MPVTITNLTSHRCLADHAEIASSVFQRATGLLSRACLRDGEALIIPRCRSIHTWFMRFAIDVVFLRGGTIVKLVERLKPFRIASSLEADTVVELPAGTIGRTVTKPGEVLFWAETPSL